MIPFTAFYGFLTRDVRGDNKSYVTAVPGSDPIDRSYIRSSAWTRWSVHAAIPWSEGEFIRWNSLPIIVHFILLRYNNVYELWNCEHAKIWSSFGCSKLIGRGEHFFPGNSMPSPIKSSGWFHEISQAETIAVWLRGGMIMWNCTIEKKKKRRGKNRVPCRFLLSFAYP